MTARRLANGPRGGDGEGLVQLVGFLLVDGAGERVAELVVGQRDGAVPVAGVAEHRRRGFERRERQREHAAERSRTDCGIDGDGGGREATPGDDHGEQAAEGVADHGGFLVELRDDVGVVVGDVAHALACEHLRVGVGLLDGLRVVGPAG